MSEENGTGSIEPLRIGASTTDSLSFDDFDALTEDSENEPSIEIEQNSDEDTENEVSEEVDTEDDSTDEATRSEEEESEESEEEEEDDSEDGEAVSKIKEILAVTKKGKKVTASVGEEELKIPSDAVFEHVVDGEKVKVNMQELLNNYSSTSNIQKHVQKNVETEKALKQTMQALETEKNEINKYFNGFLDRVNNNQGVEAFFDLVSRAGADPLEVKRAMRNSFLEEAKVILAMSEEERKTLELQEEADYLRSKDKLTEKEKSDARAKQSMHDQSLKVMEKYGIPDAETFNQVFNELHGYVAAGAIPGVTTISPVDVGEYYKIRLEEASKISSGELVSKALSSVNPELLKDESTVQAITEVVNKYAPDEATLVQLVKDEYGVKEDTASSKAEKNVNARAKANGQRITLNTATKDKVSDDNDPGINWDLV